MKDDKDNKWVPPKSLSKQPLKKILTGTNRLKFNVYMDFLRKCEND